MNESQCETTSASCHVRRLCSSAQYRTLCHASNVVVSASTQQTCTLLRLTRLPGASYNGLETSEDINTDIRATMQGMILLWLRQFVEFVDT